MPKKYVIANFKANFSESNLEKLIKTTELENTQVIVAPPYPFLSFPSVNTLEKSFLCAQDCSYYENGPFTGEVTANMLAQIGINYVLLGHSERRTNFNEKNDVILQKMKNAVKNNLKIILCVGESYEARKSNIYLEIIEEQLAILKSFENNDLKLMIAYEPVWSIGTGKIPSFSEINEMVSFISESCQNLSINAPVFYGGSIDKKNIDLLVNETNVDGFLVGNSSLNEDIFYIIDSCEKNGK